MKLPSQNQNYDSSSHVASITVTWRIQSIIICSKHLKPLSLLIRLHNLDEGYIATSYMTIFLVKREDIQSYLVPRSNTTWVLQNLQIASFTRSNLLKCSLSFQCIVRRPFVSWCFKKALGQSNSQQILPQFLSFTYHRAGNAAFAMVLVTSHDGSGRRRGFITYSLCWVYTKYCQI